MGASSHACSDQATTDARLFNPALPVPASASKKEPPLGTGWRLSKDREELKACRDHARANGAVEVGKVTVGIGAARATSSVLQSARIVHQPRCVSSPASRCGWCACGTFRRQKLRQLVRSRTILVFAQVHSLAIAARTHDDRRVLIKFAHSPLRYY